MDKIVFVSHFALENFDKLYKIDVPKLCLYNVVDVDRIKSLSTIGQVIKEEGRFVITAIGSLKEIKGFDRLIRIGKMLKDDGCSFLIQIIGEGDDLDNLVTLRNSLGLQEDIRFLGFMKNPFGYLSQSDVFVSTSLSEGLSLVICEALALGIPVVSTKTAGAMDLLDNGKFGILTEHDDLSIFHALESIYDDLNLRKEYARKSLERSKIFNAKDVLDTVYEILD